MCIRDRQKCIKTFPFSEPAEDYVFVKKAKSRLSDLTRFLHEKDIDVLVNDVGLQDLLKKKSIESQLMNEVKLEDIQLTKPQILVDAGLAENHDDAIQKLREFAISLSSSKVTEVSSSPDLHIVQSINTLDDTDKIINGMSSRLREWYGLHFPELDNIIDSINGYAQIVVAGKRENITDDVFVNAGFPDSKVQMLSLVKEKSRGGDITEKNLQIVQNLAKNILELFDLKADVVFGAYGNTKTDQDAYIKVGIKSENVFLISKNSKITNVNTGEETSYQLQLQDVNILYPAF